VRSSVAVPDDRARHGNDPMPEASSTTLLPTGLQDLLPPEAAHEAALIERLMRELSAHGYERVKPPLLEFETGLFAGVGAETASQAFRLMDPVSQKMVALRADQTPQVSRIARSRLVNAPRPLRLCYAGQVLRIQGSQLRPERQFAQVGAELIGTLDAAADAEVVLLAARAATMAGARKPTVDLCVPTVVKRICDAHGVVGEAMTRLRAALDHKDVSGVRELGGSAAALLERLMLASGPADRALAAFESVELPEAAAAERTRLGEVLRLVRRVDPALTVTVDLVEHRGYEYQTGLSFTLFARGVDGELGCGGRYRSLDNEPATGFTLYMDTLLRAVPAPDKPKRLFLPEDTPWSRGEAARRDGWVTVAGLTAVGDAAGEARRMRCDHVLIDGEIRPVV